MKKSKFVISILILMIISAFSVKVAFADTTTVGVVNAVTVNVREEPNTSSKILVQIGEDTEVDVYGEEDGWYEIVYNGITGYVSTEYIEITEWGDTYLESNSNITNTTETSNTTEENVANETSTTVETEEPEETEQPIEESGEEEEVVDTVDETVTEFTLSKDAEIRLSPSFSSSKTTAIAEGSTVTVVDEINKWVKITDGNVTGWAVRQNIQ